MKTEHMQALVLHYAKQPSTWQGFSLLAGSVAAWLGVPEEQVVAAVVGVFSLILILKDDKPAKAEVEEVIGKILSDKVDKEGDGK